MADQSLENLKSVARVIDQNKDGALSYIELGRPIPKTEETQAVLRHIYSAAVTKKSWLSTLLSGEEGLSQEDLNRIERISNTRRDQLPKSDHTLKDQIDAANRKLARIQNGQKDYTFKGTDTTLRGGYSDTCAVVSAVLAIELIEPHELTKLIKKTTEGFSIAFNSGLAAISSPNLLEQMQLSEGRRAPLIEKAFVEQYSAKNKLTNPNSWLRGEYHGEGFTARAVFEQISDRIYSENRVSALSNETLERLFYRIENEKLPAVVATKNEAISHQLKPNHAYVVLGITEDKKVKLLNSDNPFINAKQNAILVNLDEFRNAATILTWGEKK